MRKYRQQDVFDEVDDEKKEHVRYFCEEMHDEEESGNTSRLIP